ncbi:transporter associated domain-containing protein [Terrihabitans sp. B22-R8]|uniref:transporter associated domain-containing protein n=1 Tax=Terrihabitans sp. B22-R8 TaxID=3425128 RepID=UPI00403CC57E
MTASSDDSSRTSDHLPVVVPPSEPVSEQRWTSLLKRLLRMKPATSLRHEIEDALASDDTLLPDFSTAERAMLKNLLGLRERRIHDVMVPRPDIVAVSIDITLAELLMRFEEAEHSRLPVFGESIDDLRGMVHIKDVLRYVATRGRTSAGVDLTRADLSVSLGQANLLRNVLYVPPFTAASNLLAKMQATRTHMALVIDEYGGTDGLVTIEDLIEIVVGEIEDEHDEIEGPMIQKARDGSLIANARTPIEQLIERMGNDPDLIELGEEVDTVGGLIVTLAGRVPARSEIISGPSDIEFEVLEADPRRVKRVRVRRRKPEEGLPAEDTGPTILLPPPVTGKPSE